MGRLLDKYRLAMEGDALRKYAKEKDIFIFPYDLQSGADIALYENTEAKEEAQRYVVFSLEEVRPRHGKSGLHELPETCDMGSNFRAQGAGNAAGAIGHWNKRMQERTQKLQKPFFYRFSLGDSFFCFDYRRRKIGFVLKKIKDLGSHAFFFCSKFFIFWRCFSSFFNFNSFVFLCFQFRY